MARASEDYYPTEETGHGVTTDRYFAWARASAGTTDGVVKTSNSFNFSDLRVTANGSNLITVQPGALAGMGLTYTNSLAFTVAIAPNSGSAQRNDLIVVRFNHQDTGFQGSVVVVPAVSSTYSGVRNFGVSWDVPLAMISVAPGASTVPATAVADRRFAITPVPILMDTGDLSPPAILGQLQIRPGNRVLIGQEDGTWSQVYPEPAPAWTGVAFTAGWRNYNSGGGSGYYNTAYCLTSDGWLHFRGLFEATSNKAAQQSVFQLPSGYRPGASCLLTTFSANGAIRVQLQDDGRLIVWPATASGEWVSLDGVGPIYVG